MNDIITITARERKGKLPKRADNVITQKKPHPVKDVARLQASAKYKLDIA